MAINRDGERKPISQAKEKKEQNFMTIMVHRDNLIKTMVINMRVSSYLLVNGANLR
jgi:hypothetical protein